MFGSQILDVAIGVIFVYLLLSLIASAVREGLEAWLKSRAIDLEQGIRELLSDANGTGLTQSLFAHPQVRSLYHGSYDPTKIRDGRLTDHSDLPSYIPSSNFALALLDIVVRGPDVTSSSAAAPTAAPLTSETVRAALPTLKNPPVERVVLTALDLGGRDLSAVRTHLETWYDSAMERVSGRYKRRTHFILLGLGLFLAVAANVNTITLASYLYENRAARESLAGDAGRYLADTTSVQSLRPLQAEADRLKLPLGWSEGWPGPRLAGEPAGVWADAVEPILGWLITTFAISFGAPFWFDLLNKVMEVRATVKPKDAEPSASPERAGVEAVTKTIYLSPPNVPEDGGREPVFRPHEWEGPSPQAGIL